MLDTPTCNEEIISLDPFRELIQSDMQAVDKLILKQLQSDLKLIREVGKHIIGSGGKRLRPMLVILCAKACGYQGTKHIALATIIEFVHTATLLHDDVVDASELRRGQETANFIWGDRASILVGDFVYSRAFQMMASLQEMRVMEILADTTNTMATGEVLQMMNRRNPNATEHYYMEVIYRKTAKLFEAATQLSSIITKNSQVITEALTHYGKHLGIAYQLIDDVLDYSASSEKMGKNMGDDLAEGKPTLPLIYAMQQGNKTTKQLIQNAIEKKKINDISVILEIVNSTHALRYTKSVAKQQIDYATKSLQILPDTPYKKALIQLAQFVLERDH